MPCSAISKHAFFGFFQQFPAFTAAGLKTEVSDIGADRDQLTQYRTLANDIGVRSDIGRARGFLRESTDIGKTSSLFKLTCDFQIQLT